MNQNRYLGRYIRVVTSTGRWEFCRVVGVSPWHLTVRDAAGQDFLVARLKGQRNR